MRTQIILDPIVLYGSYSDAGEDERREYQGHHSKANGSSDQALQNVLQNMG
jgi:hypothetical protein